MNVELEIDGTGKSFICACLVKLYRELSESEKLKARLNSNDILIQDSNTSITNRSQALALVQFVELVKHNTSVAQDYRNIGIDVISLTDTRNRIAHCAKYDYTIVEDFVEKFLGTQSVSYLLRFSSTVVESAYSSLHINGSYGFEISIFNDGIN